MIDQKLQKKLKNILEDIMPYKPQKVIVFGSFVKNTSHKWSDIDMIVIKDTPERFLERLKKIALMCKRNQRPIDFLVYTPKEFETLSSSHNPFFNNIKKDGKVIYEQE